MTNSEADCLMEIIMDVEVDDWMIDTVAVRYII